MQLTERLQTPALRLAAANLRSGLHVSDRQFDQAYPRALRVASPYHWTPVTVAARAARLLEDAGARNIADIGAGPGKFCIVGALTTRARFTGIEQRSGLVAVARAVAKVFEARRARFLHANITDVDLCSFDGLYLYNPFYEQICGSLPLIDEAVAPSPGLFHSYVVAMLRHFHRASTGTVVVTYHGFGGRMPEGWDCVHRERAGNDQLKVWIKRPVNVRSSQGGTRPVEVAGGEPGTPLAARFVNG